MCQEILTDAFGTYQIVYSVKFKDTDYEIGKTILTTFHRTIAEDFKKDKEKYIQKCLDAKKKHSEWEDKTFKKLALELCGDENWFENHHNWESELYERKSKPVNDAYDKMIDERSDEEKANQFQEYFHEDKIEIEIAEEKIYLDYSRKFLMGETEFKSQHYNLSEEEIHKFYNLVHGEIK